MRAQLVPISGGKPVVLKKDINVIGRSEGSCDLVLPQRTVSSVHCMIIKTDGLLFVRDLASTNGTRVNGQRITRGALLPGDELTLASVRFKVQFGRAAMDEEVDRQTEFLNLDEIEDEDDESSLAETPDAEINTSDRPSSHSDVRPLG